MNGFRAFDDVDWMGMAGAERFPDGSEPLVCYDIKVDELDTWAVIDANGFYLAVMTPYGDIFSEIVSDRDNGAAILRLLVTMDDHHDNGMFRFETGELIDMGLAPKVPGTSL